MALGIYPWQLNLLGVCFFLNGVFVKFILGKTTFSLDFLHNISNFNWVSMNYYAFCYLFFERQLGIPKNNCVNINQKAAYLFYCITHTACIRPLLNHHLFKRTTSLFMHTYIWLVYLFFIWQQHKNKLIQNVLSKVLKEGSFSHTAYVYMYIKTRRVYLWEKHILLMVEKKA